MLDTIKDFLSEVTDPYNFVPFLLFVLCGLGMICLTVVEVVTIIHK